MNAGVYLLPSGREVRLRGLCIEPTYLGLLAGTRETASLMILRSSAKWAQSTFYGSPVVVVPPLRIPLPPFRFGAAFESRRPVRETDSDFVSRLAVVWFGASLAESLDELITSALAGVDREQNAADKYLDGL